MRNLLLITFLFASFFLYSNEVKLELPNSIQNTDTLSLQQDTSIVLYPDVEAEFLGGSSRMMKYFIENLEYHKMETSKTLQ
jgi:hypothetical protein